MILYKTIEPETALLMIAQVVGESLPEKTKNSDAELTLTFEDDHSITVYLIEPEEKNNQS